MKKRHQLLEEAGRLRRLSQAKRGDLAWAALTGRLSEVELDHRAADARSLLLRAEELERHADDLPDPHAPAGREAVEARRRRQQTLLARAAEIRDREAACRRIGAQERALGAEQKAEFLDGVARQLAATWQHLESQAYGLPAVVAAERDDQPQHAVAALALSRT